MSQLFLKNIITNFDSLLFLIIMSTLITSVFIANKNLYKNIRSTYVPFA